MAGSGYEVGSAFVTVMPSARGFAGALASELDAPFLAAGRRGGDQITDGVTRSGQQGFAAAGGALGKVFVGAFVAMGAANIAQAVYGWLSEAVGQASDLAETINKSSTIFGDNAEAIEAWAGTAAEAAGLSKGAALDAAAGFGNMFTQLGFASGEAASLSTSTVQLAADLGSFNNLPTADVADKISAAFRGEYDSLQALIPNINAARVEQEALAATGKTSTDQLTAQEKASAVLAIVTRDGAAALGDYARTSDGMANSQKTLTAEMENTKAEIGTALLPVMTDLLNVFKDVGVPILQDLAAGFTENKDEIGAMILAVADGVLAFAQAVAGYMEHLSRMADFWVTVTTNLAQTWLNVVETVLDGAVAMFGWVPGMGDRLKEAQDHFEGFRADTDAKFSSIRASMDANTQGWQSIQDGIAGVRNTLASLDGKGATIHINADGNAVALLGDGSGRVSGAGMSFRAGGGPVTAGVPYVVGEREAEIFVPGQSGRVYNQDQWAAATGGSGPTFAVSVTADSALAAEFGYKVANQATSRLQDLVATHGIGG